MTDFDGVQNYIINRYGSLKAGLIGASVRGAEYDNGREVVTIDIPHDPPSKVVVTREHYDWLLRQCKEGASDGA